MVMRRVVATAVCAAALAGCGADRVVDPGPELGSFAERPLTWVSQEDAEAVLHVGDEERRLPPYVTALRPTAHGFLVTHRLGPGIDAEEVDSLVAADGVQRLPGEPSGLTVSPDGRYAGWIDFDGPRRIGYRLAEAVVVDLSTGLEVLRDHRDMGGWTDQDLYGNVWPSFLGFDADGAAYWETPQAGDDDAVVRRLDLASGEVTGVDEDAETVAYTRVVQPGLGRVTPVGDDGLPRDGDGGLGVVSPGGRWCLTTGTTGAVPVVDCRTGRRATPDYPAANVRLAGWTDDPDAFWALVTDDALDVRIPPTEPDPSRGELVRCTLPRGACTPVELVRRLGSLVLPGGLDP